ncbi:DUF1573 domain-containing protein [Roseiconus lacunae]|uniref:DUF1573 domain-containing protein n=1 Tax=Roseiconus lacunae TaxID=2605694 RepID=UPI00308AB492|nr:DUF1573 domain-containing protein [Stieleria sp. HD01]
MYTVNFSRWFAAVLFAAALLCESRSLRAANETPRLIFDGTEEEFSRLPILAKVEAIGGKVVHRVKLSKGFEGEDQIFRVQIVNNGDTDVSIKKLVSSCGCTLAQPKDREIPEGGVGYVLVRLLRSRVGGFEEAVTIPLAGREHQGIFEGTTVRRISGPPEVEFDSKGTASLKISVIDPEIDIAALSFVVAGNHAKVVDKHSEAETVTLELSWNRRTRFAESLLLVPKLQSADGDAHLIPMTIRTRFSGMVRVVPTSLYIREGVPPRIFLFGDLSELTSKSSNADDPRLDVHCTILPQGGQGPPRQCVVSAKIKALKGVVSLTFDKEAFSDVASGSVVSAELYGSSARFSVYPIDS